MSDSGWSDPKDTAVQMTQMSKKEEQRNHKACVRATCGLRRFLKELKRCLRDAVYVISEKPRFVRQTLPLKSTSIYWLACYAKFDTLAVGSQADFGPQVVRFIPQSRSVSLIKYR